MKTLTLAAVLTVSLLAAPAATVMAATASNQSLLDELSAGLASRLPSRHLLLTGAGAGERIAEPGLRDLGAWVTELASGRNATIRAYLVSPMSEDNKD